MSRVEFVNKVLALYLTADGTPSRVSRSDRLLAGSLYDQGFTVDQLETAFTLNARGGVSEIRNTRHFLQSGRFIISCLFWRK